MAAADVDLPHMLKSVMDAPGAMHLSLSLMHFSNFVLRSSSVVALTSVNEGLTPLGTFSDSPF